MYKASLLLLLFTSSSFAADQWKKVTSGFRSIAYADLGAIRKNGDITSMPVLVDYEKQPFDGNNLPYLSLRMDVEYDCKKTQFRAVAVTSYSGHMATGDRPYTSVDPEDWQPILPTNIQKSLWEVACVKRYPSGPAKVAH